VADVTIGHGHQLDAVTKLCPFGGGSACFVLGVIGMGPKDKDVEFGSGICRRGGEARVCDQKAAESECCGKK
jgi:hypothetical protein